MHDNRHRPSSGTLDRASGTGTVLPLVTTDRMRGDPLSDVLDTVRLRGALFFLWQPGVDFATGVADGRTLARHILPGAGCIVSYHVVVSGSCYAAVNGAEPVRLQTGDTLLLPHGDSYKIASVPCYPTPADAAASVELFRSMMAGNVQGVVSSGDDPAPCSLICGFLDCDPGPCNPLLAALPPLLRVSPPAARDDPLSSLIAFAMTEAVRARGGERTLLIRLSELMFVEVLRRYLSTGSADESRWLRALRDPVVGRALGFLHGNPAAPWTLERLAHRIGTSRSTLSERFKKSLDTPPMRYLAAWRMQVAADRLRNPSNKIQSVALEVGYDSEAAFSRAFKRIVGLPPAAWRIAGD